MGELQKRIEIDKAFTEKETEVGIACRKRLEMFGKWVEEMRQEFPFHCQNCDWLVDNKPKITCPNAQTVTRYLSKRCSIANCPEKDEWFEKWLK